MLLLNKSLPDEKFQAYRLACGTSTFEETTLCGNDNFVSFQVPDKSVIDHTCQLTAEYLYRLLYFSLQITPLYVLMWTPANT